MATTTVIVPGQTPISGIPGTKDAAWVRATYGADMNLAGLDVTERDNGEEHIVEFKARSGTKGSDLAIA